MRSQIIKPLLPVASAHLYTCIIKLTLKLFIGLTWFTFVLINRDDDEGGNFFGSDSSSVAVQRLMKGRCINLLIKDKKSFTENYVFH